MVNPAPHFSFFLASCFSMSIIVFLLFSPQRRRRLQRELQKASRQMADELALAAQMQASIITRPSPSLPGWQVADVDRMGVKRTLAEMGLLVSP